MITPKATFFEHCYYNGRSSSLEVGNYNVDQMVLPNDFISSVRVPSGLKVTLYEHSNFQGRSVDLTRDTECLAGNPYNFNDMTSSIRIQKI